MIERNESGLVFCWSNYPHKITCYFCESLKVEKLSEATRKRLEEEGETQ